MAFSSSTIRIDLFNMAPLRISLKMCCTLRPAGGGRMSPGIQPRWDRNVDLSPLSRRLLLDRGTLQQAGHRLAEDRSMAILLFGSRQKMAGAVFLSPAGGAVGQA